MFLHSTVFILHLNFELLKYLLEERVNNFIWNKMDIVREII